MIRKIDLNDIKDKSHKIAKKPDKPFDDMNIERRHKELLEFQNKTHKEILKSQNSFNEENTKQQKKLVEWTRYLAITTIILVIATIIISAGSLYFSYNMNLNTKNAIDFEKNLYSPKITAEITDGKFPWPIYGNESIHRVNSLYWNNTNYTIPIYVEINNNGIIPFQLYNIEVQTNCGLSKPLLDCPKNFSKLIAGGASLSFRDTITFKTKKPLQINNVSLDDGTVINNLTLAQNHNIVDLLPCNIDFKIYGQNLVIDKRIVVIKDFK